MQRLNVHNKPANGRRFSSLTAAEGRFAKRLSAAMSEETFPVCRLVQNTVNM